jgi:hypothetical protein
MSKNSDKVSELLDDIGQDSEEKGAKATIKYHKSLQKENQKKKDDFLNKLDTIKKKEIYYRTVWEEARLRSLEFSVPHGWQWKFGISEKGLALYIYDGRHTYAQGMKVTGKPESDAKGIEALLSMGLDYMDSQISWKN